MIEQLGHTIKLMYPTHVTPYVKNNKNDCPEAESVCEGVSRPTMRCVSIKKVERADIQAVPRTRSHFVKHWTAVIIQRASECIAKKDRNEINKGTGKAESAAAY